MEKNQCQSINYNKPFEQQNNYCRSEEMFNIQSKPFFPNKLVKDLQKNNAQMQFQGQWQEQGQGQGQVHDFRNGDFKGSNFNTNTNNHPFAQPRTQNQIYYNNYDNSNKFYTNNNNYYQQHYPNTNNSNNFQIESPINPNMINQFNKISLNQQYGNINNSTSNNTINNNNNYIGNNNYDVDFDNSNKKNPNKNNNNKVYNTINSNSNVTRNSSSFSSSLPLNNSINFNTASYEEQNYSEYSQSNNFNNQNTFKSRSENMTQFQKENKQLFTVNAKKLNTANQIYNPNLEDDESLSIEQLVNGLDCQLYEFIKTQKGSR
jgi:hypothetical protein